MKIRITEHAKERMLRYGISEEQIEEALDTPDSIAKGDKGRKIAQKRLNGYVLRIIYEEDLNGKVVITTYKARSERYEI
ncbi:MAG: DUF4258 domain-containing protein [Candidatus Diapherotrites archaeon]|uniref:DUF4258 domain-containing protein n=1 Tax=Candidatus Iainarchaeum sp. TaxID=3101447 RepID=A0A8T4KVU9_9ARCH|nr:DUF4258 domain-containing protein [Candidatus Diapherotrites archaeon]